MTKRDRLLAAEEVGGAVAADRIFEAAVRNGNWQHVASEFCLPYDVVLHYLDEVTSRKRKATRWSPSEIEILKAFILDNMKSKEKKNYRQLQSKLPERSIKALRMKVAEIAANIEPKMDSNVVDQISNMRDCHGDNWDLIGSALSFPDSEKLKQDYLAKENDPCATNVTLDSWFL